jgi:WD40 repeat protein
MSDPLPPTTSYRGTVPEQEELSAALPSVPGYETLAVLGRGGMGVVYRAVQTKLKRPVALKMILAGGHAGPQILARFQGEAEAVARLQHPNIVQIYEVGEHKGLPFFSMELVEGGSLSQQLAGTPQPPRQAAAVLEVLARAVHHAHQRGIVHRDLKPANVLLGDDGTPKIADFGLAKQLDGEPGALATGGQTASGAILGTPSYMAPEQAAGRSREIGPTADVWALGAILYTQLTGRPPFTGATPLDTLQQVLKREPVSPWLLQPGVPRDLETICLKCLRKESRQRYASAEALADDIRAFLDGRPIQARPIGVLGRLGRWCRRKPAAALLLMVLLATAIFGPLAFVYQRILTASEKQAKEAEKQAREDAQEKGRLAGERERSVRRQLFLNQLNQARQALDRNDAGAMFNLLQSSWPEPDQEDLRSFDWYHLWWLCHRERLTIDVQQAHPTNWLALGGLNAVRFADRGDRLVTLWHGSSATSYGVGEAALDTWNAATGELLSSHELGGKRAFRAPYALSADARVVAAAGLPGTVRLWDSATADVVATLTLPAGLDATALDFAPDGKTLAIALGTPGRNRNANGPAPGQAAKAVQLWDLPTRRPRAVLEGEFDAVHFAPDGKVLATHSSADNDEIALWDVATARELRKFSRAALPCAFSADGRLLAAADGAAAAAAVHLWDTTSGERTGPSIAIAAAALAFSPNGQVLAVRGRSDGGVHLFTLPAGQEAVYYRDCAMGGILAFSPDGRTLLGGEGDATLKMWDGAPPAEQVYPGSSGHQVECVALSPDGSLLATGGSSFADRAHPGEVQVWDTATGRERPESWHFQQPVYALAFSPDGKQLAAGGGNWRQWTTDPGEVMLVDLSTRAVRPVVGPAPRMVFSVAFSPDGKTLAVGGGSATLWDVASGKLRQTVQGTRGTVCGVAFSPDGKRLATGSGTPQPSGEVQVWDLATGKEQIALKEHKAVVYSVAFSPGGDRLASASHDGTARIWQLEGNAGREIGAVTDDARLPMGCVAFSPDGNTLSCLGASCVLYDLQWNPEVGQFEDPSKLNVEKRAYGGHLVSISYAGRGGLRATGSGVWELWDGPILKQSMHRRHGHDDEVRDVAISADGRTCATVDGYKTVLLWDTATGEERARRRFSDENAGSESESRLALTPDGSTVAVPTGWDLVLWDARTNQVRTLDRVLGFAGALAFSPDGRILATAEQVKEEEKWFVRLRDAATGRELRRVEGEGPLAFSRDGQTLAFNVVDAKTNLIRRRLLDLASEQSRESLEPNPLFGGSLNSLVAESPDGLCRASPRVPLYRQKNEVVFEDVATGQERCTLEESVWWLRCLAFSPDGTLLVSAGGGWLPCRPQIWRAATPEQAAAQHAQWQRRAAVRKQVRAGQWTASNGYRMGPIAGEVTDNSDILVRQHRGGLKFSTHRGSADKDAFNAVDGSPTKSWQPFESNAAPVAGSDRWFEVVFPAEVAVRRVTLLGARPWGSGLQALRLQLRGADGTVIQSCPGECVGDYRDFEFRLAAPVEGVKTLRFVLPADLTPDAAAAVDVGEILAE